jgi:hypothetical protein
MKRIDLRRFWQENAEYGIQNRADFVVSNADGPEGTQSAAWCFLTRIWIVCYVNL